MLKAEDYERGMVALRNREYGAHALVIGNSPWRRAFPVGAWFGPTIACNAYYRDADRFPTYLVAHDPMMIQEIVKAHVYRDTTIVLRQNEAHPHVLDKVPAEEVGHWFYLDLDPSFEADYGDQAGTMAITLAGWLGCASITLIGFSLSLDNLYAGSANYGPSQNSVPGSYEPYSAFRRAFAEFHRLSPGASVHWVAPSDWMLAKLDQGAAVR
jgi:hypothetical protein